jgi:A/G-specific adenine glycosylase
MAARPRIKQPPGGLSLAGLLLEWYHRGHRDLPWRSNPDPYRVWISEIMLQQTRAQAVIPYYHRFLQRFPTVEALAGAGEDEVLTMWSGLGYYSRARNLLRAARAIAAQAAEPRSAAAGFPAEYASLRALPGIGDYTAAAIASIAFGKPCVVVDGNVLRVVARVENDAADIAGARTRERFRSVAQSWLDPCDPGAFNQALMELGATVCLPRKPLCLLCPLASLCQAREQGTAAQLPVKLRKIEPVSLEGILLVVRSRGGILLRRREPEARRMAGFWDLPSPEDLPAARCGRTLGAFRHTITHHHYTFTVRKAVAAKIPVAANAALRWFRPAECLEIPLSTTARKGLKLAGVLTK